MKFRKRPVVIEAMQFDGNMAETHAVYLWAESHVGSVQWPETGEPVPASGVSIDPATGFMVVFTLEGRMQVKRGDWVIRGVQGEFYPCKPEIFDETYERVDE